MQLKMYVKPNVVGLLFASQKDRDMIWTLLGDHRDCAERFGERTIRFNPAKSTGNFSVPLETDEFKIITDKPVIAPSRPEPAKEVAVMPAAPALIAPIAIIPTEPSTVAAMVIEQPTPAPQPPVAQLPPAMVEVPQVASVIHPLQPPKPPDLRSRAGRAWKAQQQQPA